ncbi:hypothetical protein FRX31_021954 [Thalictrum thalictroides]|uniref:Uncharacterized protein n=1 Tax=Thalictrum thalictroides TaxID=46969 RepID=A0A7J6VTQ0_THATH|nr:hypothetical protein FRX31_021954 [Thalictrum thalictroides]
MARVFRRTLFSAVRSEPSNANTAASVNTNMTYKPLALKQTEVSRGGKTWCIWYPHTYFCPAFGLLALGP